MPVMDGLQATREIRRLDGANGQIPIIALTANAVSGIAERWGKAGMDAYVAKPIEADCLFAAIDACLDDTAGQSGRPKKGQAAA